jgi:hypothetical protein
MQHKRRIVMRLLKLAVACVVIVALTAHEGFGQVRGPASPAVQVGAYAPDFNLPRLTITNDPNGKPLGIIRDVDTVRLASFRGKRPVCLIMSSYT